MKGRWKCSNPACYLFNDDGYFKNVLGESLNKQKIIEIYDKRNTRIYGGNERQGIFRPECCICGCKDFIYLETIVKNKDLKFQGKSDIIIDCSNLDEKRFGKIRLTFNKKFLPRDGKVIVADFKTINQSSWNFQLEKRGPHKSYIIQLIIYVYILDCDYGILMYENKNNSEIKWYKIERNDDWWEIIKWQSYAMQDMAKDKKLPPPRPNLKTSYDCKKCEFKNLCHKSKIWQDPNLNEKRKNFYKELL